MIEERDYPLVVAHRGASALAPENTIAAFDRAVRDGAEGIEFDVRLANDLIPMVFHDSDLNRICGIGAELRELTSDELGKLDTGSWFNKDYPSLAKEIYSSQTVPSLSETLDLFSQFDGIIYVELKSDGEDISPLVNAVCNLVNSTSLIDQIILKSFDLSAIALIKKEFPHISAASLFEPTIRTVLRKEEQIVRASEKAGADRISVHYSLATKRLVNLAKKADLPVTIWTADSTLWIKRGIDLGIDHIITNDPSKLLVQRQRILERA